MNTNLKNKRYTKWTLGLLLSVMVSVMACNTDTRREQGNVPSSTDRSRAQGLDTTHLGSSDREYGDTISRVGSVGSQQAIDSARVVEH